MKRADLDRLVKRAAELADKSKDELRLLADTQASNKSQARQATIGWSRGRLVADILYAEFESFVD